MTNQERAEFLALKDKIKKLTIANRGLNKKLTLYLNQTLFELKDNKLEHEVVK